MSGNKIEITDEIRSRWNEILDRLVTEGEYSAYGIHTVLNKILVEVGAEKIRPQMMYNYARNGMIVRGAKIFGETLRPFTASEVREFVIRYGTRNNVQIDAISQIDPNQLELDLEM
jgi:hypothetical protein